MVPVNVGALVTWAEENFFSAKVIYDGETSESLVPSRQIGPVE
jgi:hypothetical protein